MAHIAYNLYRLSGIIAPKIPPGVGYALCRFLAWFLYQLNTQGKSNIQLNLRRVMANNTPDTEINRLTRLTFNHILFNYFDLFRLPGLDNNAVDKLVAVEGWENVEAALAQGTGIVMASAHLGNIEIVLYAMLLRGLKITIPVERVEPPELFNYITTLRSSKGLNLIPVDGPLLHLIRTLKKGGVAGLAGDRDITNTGQVSQFFNHPAHLPDGHIKLALKTGSPLVMGFSRRNPDHSYHAYFLPAYQPLQSGTEDEQVAAGMDYIIKEMERAIRQTPEQWTLTVSIWADN